VGFKVLGKKNARRPAGCTLNETPRCSPPPPLTPARKRRRAGPKEKGIKEKEGFLKFVREN